MTTDKISAIIWRRCDSIMPETILPIIFPECSLRSLESLRLLACFGYRCPIGVFIGLFRIYHVYFNFILMHTIEPKISIKPFISTLFPIYMNATEDKDACGLQCGLCCHTNHHSLLPRGINFKVLLLLT